MYLGPGTQFVREHQFRSFVKEFFKCDFYLNLQPGNKGHHMSGPVLSVNKVKEKLRSLENEDICLQNKRILFLKLPTCCPTLWILDFPVPYSTLK